mgnify:CR=1 FL=1
MDVLEIKKVIETLLFITDRPLSIQRLSQICNVSEEKVEGAVKELESDYEKYTLQIMHVAGGYQMATRQEYGAWVRKLYHSRMTIRLSSASLETLAIIAYKQPVTRAEIERIRGVEVIGPLETLIERRLVTSLGRKETVGRPMLYGTTDEFLRQFGLNSLDDLPPMENFETKKGVNESIAENTEGEDMGDENIPSEEIDKQDPDGLKIENQNEKK